MSAELIELKCRNCGAPLTPENLSIELSAAQCPKCQAWFVIPGLSAPAAREKKIGRPLVPQPKSITIERLPGSLEIRRRWRSAMAFGLLFFAIFWNGFMIVWMSVAIRSGRFEMAAFGSIHACIGLGLIYYVAALFLNSTTLRISRREVGVKNGPLPWRGNKTLPGGEIEQVYCVEKPYSTRNGAQRRMAYSLMLVMRGNRREVLVASIPSYDDALFIEQQIEAYLGIEDIPVDGECGR